MAPPSTYNRIGYQFVISKTLTFAAKSTPCCLLFLNFFVDHYATTINCFGVFFFFFYSLTAGHVLDATMDTADNDDLKALALFLDSEIIDDPVATRNEEIQDTVVNNGEYRPSNSIL